MNNLSKRLETRHVNMIALGGSIGTGIFLASGYSISLGGPGGAIAGYTIMSIIIYFLMTSVGEMSVYKPSAGGVADYASNYVGKSFGFGMGYTYWFTWAITIAAEISAASLVAGYWFPQINPTIFSVLFFLLICAINILSVKWYGEIEYSMSFIKVAIIIIFIAVGVVALFKEPNFGVHNLTIGDAPFHNGWYGFISVFLFAGYAFQGTELIGVASEETKNPEIALPKSVKLVFWRLTLFYVISIVIICLLIPYTNPNLTNQSNVATSPYTILFTKYLSKHAGNVINFIILIALISAANASLYSSTRTLWYLANKSQNKWLTKINSRHVPINAMLVTMLVGSLAFISSLIGNGKAFSALVNVSSITWFVAAIGIAWSHYKFRTNYLPQHGGVAVLTYKAKLFPYAPIMTIIALVFIIAAQFITFDSSYTLVDKLSVYGGVAPFFIFYFVHKIYTNYKIL